MECVIIIVANYMRYSLARLVLLKCFFFSLSFLFLIFLSLFQFPELLWDENSKRVLSFKLVDLMLLRFPFWRREKFNETVQALGNYCDKVALQEIADNFWLRCCESLPNEMKGIDFHCWKVLAEAFSLCALHPALCARMILYKILLHRKRYLDRQYYQVSFFFLFLFFITSIYDFT